MKLVTLTIFKKDNMKKLLASFALVSAILAAPAQAVVIDFDSTGTAGAYNSLDYTIDGFAFNFTLDNIDVSPASGWSGTGPAHTGNFAALNNHGGNGEITKADGGNFSFQSLWVKNWYVDSGRLGSITGLLDGNIVAFVSGSSGNNWNEITGNFSYIDTLRIGFGNYFLIDTITLDQASAVPEPATTALLGLGLLGFIASRRRKN